MGDRVRGSILGAEKSISVYNQSPRSTQSGHLSVGRRNEYQRAVMPCGWRVKAGMVREWVAGKTVWSPCYHGPYLIALAMGSSHNRALYKCPITLLYFTLLCAVIMTVFTLLLFVFGLSVTLSSSSSFINISFTFYHLINHHHHHHRHHHHHHHHRVYFGKYP